MGEVGVIIAGGGQGKRVGGKTPKQFLSLNGIPILVRTVLLFDRMREVGSIVVVVPPGYEIRARRMTRKSGCRKISAIVRGGTSRQVSVWKGMQAFSADPGIVLVHDAVRPFIRASTVRNVIRAVNGFGAAVVGVPVTDTIKVGSREGFFLSTPDRRTLWAVQTPQGFRFDLLSAAHRAAMKNRFVGTDEASLVERLGVRVRIVEGEYGNTKITTRDDLRVAKMKAK